MNRIMQLVILGFVSLVVASENKVADPDPARYAESIKAFINWDEKNSSPDNAILFVGSSSIRMWKTGLAFPGYPVINRGFGGAHFSDVLYYYDDVIKKYDARIIVVYVGDNDIAGDKPVQQVYDDYLKLTNKIVEDFPEAKMVFVTIKPSGSRWKYWEAMSETNSLIEQYNFQYPNLYYIDLATPLLDKKGRPDDSLFLADRLHLNESGYQKWNNVLIQLLAEIY